MKKKRICKGLTLVHKKDGFWLNFKTKTGRHHCVNFKEYSKNDAFTGKTILEWAKETLKIE